ncbi:hypothetical protein H6F93_29055 [Leptolyngbya sp. FACHB-671]|uniref:hypothetical protein n=1 Tax=Leptolyngbya sp. FACHB-671 TaxID=2692812 RepID=UPI001684165F|nr:hypothetical protein [Leptolyngbya sp. FACHB-671]MBD2071518.1 hypothetical protein [Leptolyngbya sp. FACHB-671]
MPSLRTTLLVDSIVCFVYGAVLTIAADSLSTLFTTNPISLLGYSLPDALRILGWSVLGVGLYVCVVGCAKPIRPIAAWLVIGIEIAWTVGSVLLLAWIGNTLSWIGIAFIISSAVAVLGFMILELIGLQSLYERQI